MNPVLLALLGTVGFSGGMHLLGKYIDSQKPTPTATPTPQPTATPMPTPTPTPTMGGSILGAKYRPGNVDEEQARPIIQKIITGYQPKTPDVPQGWRSPMVDHIDLLTKISAKYGLDPRLLALLAISETQLLRPQASGTAANNPFNVMEPGTQTLHKYGSVPEAIEKYGSGVSGRYRMFNRLPPDATFKDFIMTQNPEDNPQMQLDNLVQLAKQLGVE